jgi:hypothetical protein
LERFSTTSARRLNDGSESTVPFPPEFTETEKLERQQLEADARYMTGRLAHIDTELATEPLQIEALYEVALHRLSPVGLVVLWPSTRP